MNYDQWKTMSDRDDSTDMVSPCCGAEYSEYPNYMEYISTDFICDECKDGFDILQSTQYSTPIPSTVRELATNGADAQREKEMAVEILTGKAKVEDYYIERHGDQYSDSNFDISYYNLDHLDTENNDVLIT